MIVIATFALLCLTSQFSKELPFVYECPATLVALSELLEGKNSDDCKTVLSRVIACHNIHLDGRNSSKMEVMIGSQTYRQTDRRDGDRARACEKERDRGER